MSNANSPAMPHPLAMSSDGNMYGIGEHDPCSGGLTKLEHFAGLAMQGLLSSYGRHDVTCYSEIASDAVMASKALLKQLEGESNE